MSGPVPPASPADPRSAIHTLQPHRADLKILAGPPDNPRLHSLNGDVVTPLFHHLGTSSWHSFDAALIVTLGRSTVILKLLVIVTVAVVVTLIFFRRRALRLTTSAVLHRDPSFYRRILQGYGRTRRRSDALDTDRMA